MMCVPVLYMFIPAHVRVHRTIAQHKITSKLRSETSSCHGVPRTWCSAKFPVTRRLYVAPVPDPGSGGALAHGHTLARSRSSTSWQPRRCQLAVVPADAGGRVRVQGVSAAVGETVILLHPPLPLVGVSMRIERGYQQKSLY